MVTARLNGRVHNKEYTMLMDSGSELNIMTLSQAHELALPIDKSGLTRTLSGISGHTMNLEGICWDIPVKIGGLIFAHNFFVSHDGLGNKDMVLGQPWLFSQSAKIEYIHDLGMKVQLWEGGNREGRSILINLPLVNAQRNVMPGRASAPYLSRSAEVVPSVREELKRPGDDPRSVEFPRFLNRAIESLERVGMEVNQLETEGLGEDLLSPESLANPFFAEIIKKAWFSIVKEDNETLNERLGYKVKATHGGAEPRTIDGAKYKPVARKVVPVSTLDPDSVVPEYKPIRIGRLPDLPVRPTGLEDLSYTRKMTKDRVSAVISRIPAGFLTKAEVELLVGVFMANEDAVAFTDAERGSFSAKYYPDYVIRTIPHEPWQRKSIRLPQSRREEVLHIMKTHISTGRYEPSSASYRSTFFAVEKKGGLLRIVHDLQPLNAVTIRDATLPPRVEDMIESFSGCAVFGLFDLKAGYDNRILAPASRDLTSFFVDGIGLLRLTVLPQGHTNSVAEFQRSTQHMIGPMSPECAEVFIDDCAAKGPRSHYEHETIPGNDGIRRFIWEYAKVVKNCWPVSANQERRFLGQR